MSSSPMNPDAEFDPYHQWLGIPQKDQPANHYRLLGVSLFESDLGVIENAADRQMMHLRSMTLGKHGKLAQGLLNEISAAKVCLLSADRKQAYDNELRADANPLPTPITATATAPTQLPHFESETSSSLTPPQINTSGPRISVNSNSGPTSSQTIPIQTTTNRVAQRSAIPAARPVRRPAGMSRGLIQMLFIVGGGIAGVLVALAIYGQMEGQRAPAEWEVVESSQPSVPKGPVPSTKPTRKRNPNSKTNRRPSDNSNRNSTNRRPKTTTNQNISNSRSAGSRPSFTGPGNRTTSGFGNGETAIKDDTGTTIGFSPTNRNSNSFSKSRLGNDEKSPEELIAKYTNTLRTDQSNTMRARAASSLARIDGEPDKILPILVRYLKLDPSFNVKKECLLGIQSRAEDAAGELENLEAILDQFAGDRNTGKEFLGEMVVTVSSIDSESAKVKQIITQAFTGKRTGTRITLDDNKTKCEAKIWACKTLQKIGADGSWAKRLLKNLLTRCSTSLDKFRSATPLFEETTLTLAMIGKGDEDVNKILRNYIGGKNIRTQSQQLRTRIAQAVDRAIDTYQN